MRTRRFISLCVVTFLAARWGSASLSFAQERTAREVRKACDEEIAKIKAKAELRLARQNDLGPQRSAKLARIEHQEQMTQIVPRLVKSERALEATKREDLRKKTAYVLDASRGGVDWPAVFDDGRFAGDRAQIDAVFAGASRYGVQLWPEESAKAVSSAWRMEAMLKTMLGEMHMQGYSQAKGFLRDLRAHCRLSVPSLADTAETAKKSAPAGNQMSLASSAVTVNN